MILLYTKVVIFISKPIKVYSEIGKLKKVLLHRPGCELENLMPEYLERLLFDDIPYLKIAQEEHDAFANVLSNIGAEVVYLKDLVAEAVDEEEIKDEFIEEFIKEAGVNSNKKTEVLKEYFKSLDVHDMIDKMTYGIRKNEIETFSKRNLLDFLDNEYPFIIDPLPNLYFTRDPFACVGKGVTIHKMHTVTRNRETLFAKYIFKYHPEYNSVKLWYDRVEDYSIEGGDILILNEEVIAVGISQRTHPNAVEKFARTVLREDKHFKKVLAINIPKERAFMHLDTVFTMVDYDKFTIHPNIRDDMKLHVLQLNSDNKLEIIEEHGSIEDILKKHLNLSSITLIKCGGNSIIDAAREQWNDGSNTLAIAPGEVVVYSRNYVTNKVLVENGIKIHVIPSSELSRGRGGPRCMSMPLIREDL